MIGEIEPWILISGMLVLAAGTLIGFMVMAYNLLTEI